MIARGSIAAFGRHFFRLIDSAHVAADANDRHVVLSGFVELQGAVHFAGTF